MHAPRRLRPGDLRLLGGKSRIRSGMEPWDMADIAGVLDRLQPVAVVEIGPEHALARAVLQHVIFRQQRRRQRTDIGEDQTGLFLHRVSALSDLVLEVAVWLLAGLLQTLAVHVEQPAVIAAAQALLLDTAIDERRAAMCAK